MAQNVTGQLTCQSLWAVPRPSTINLRSSFTRLHHPSEIILQYHFLVLKKHVLLSQFSRGKLRYISKGSLNEQKVQKNSICLKLKSFVTIQRSFLIDSMCPCKTELFSSLRKKKTSIIKSNSKTVVWMCLCFIFYSMNLLASLQLARAASNALEIWRLQVM